MEKVKDFQTLASHEVIFSKYISIHRLQNFDPGDVWEYEVTSFPRLGIDEDDGMILTLRGDRRGAEVFMDRGREVSNFEADNIRQYDNRAVPTFHVWDFRISAVQETDGPAARAELLESFEHRKKRTREEEKEKRDVESGLGSAVKELTSFLKGKGPEESMGPNDVYEYMTANFNPSQIEEMLLQVKDKVSPPGEKIVDVEVKNPRRKK